jgi:hypothetical protein
MAFVDDVVQQVLDYAGKTGTAPSAIVRGRVIGVIDSINAAMRNYTLKSSDHSTTVSANAITVQLPKTCRQVIELGKYDAATDRIVSPYVEISEPLFHQRYAGIGAIGTADPAGYNEWFFVKDATDQSRVIRLVRPPSAGFTLMVTFFERLTDQNADRLEQRDLIYNGTIARLGAWFPVDFALAYRLYTEGIEMLKSSRRSLRRIIEAQNAPDIEQHNTLASWLVS